ncbi:MAG: MFS transporter [Chloroflexi bacterium]|nr:MFS transporter [Chloroflexota bacterium]
MPAAQDSANLSIAHTMPRLGLRAKAIYGVGGVADAVKTVVFGLFLLFFYTTVVGLPASLVGIIAAVGLVWDAVIDPYIGHVSDFTRSRLGRRHLYMLVGASLMGLSFWALFSPPPDLPTWALAGWLLITSLLVRTMTSLFSVPYLALGAELSQDYHERNSIAGVRGGLAILGTLAAAALAFVVFFPNTTPGIDPKLNYDGYPMMGLTFGIVMTVVALIATLGTLRWRSYVRDADIGVKAGQSLQSFFAGVIASFKIGSFRALFISFSLFFLAVVINATLSIYFLTYYVEITDSAALGLIQGGFYGGAFVGVVFWLRVSKVMEKRWLYFVSTSVTSLAMIGAVLLFGEGNPLGVGNTYALLAGHLFVGFFASIIWVIPFSMIADIADEDELATGQRREGAFFGIFYFGQQIAAGLSILITGVFIDLYAGLIAGDAALSDLTIQRIAVLYGILPAVLLIASAIVIMRYSLDRKKVVKIQARLAERRQSGTVQL